MTERKAEIIRICHPPMPQAWMEEAAADLMEQHDDRDHSGTITTTPCVLLALLLEILRYRNQYGHLDLPASSDYYIRADEEAKP
jgi:hypothetical protein